MKSLLTSNYKADLSDLVSNGGDLCCQASNLYTLEKGTEKVPEAF